jgi:thiosulfate/3-mercaptopyruvate sulfurtransferase
MEARMLRNVLTVVLVVCTVLAASTVSTTQGTVQAPANMVVQTNWLAVHLSDKNLVILHVGADRASYITGHIPGARFLALSDIAVTRNGIPNELPPVSDLKTTFERLGVGDRSRVVLYGDMFGLFAARAYFTLDYLGHGNTAALLDGGLEKWSREHEVARTPSVNPAAGVLTVHPHPELVMELAPLRQVVSNNRVVLIDARPFADYSGAPSADIRRGGHIPGAKNVFWAETLVSRENPIFKPVSKIRARYTAAGLKPGGKAIVYCRTGVQAAHDYFTLKLTGFRPVLYDASFIDWANAFGTPVETGNGGVH